jgi:hypothetical protein
MPPSPQQKESPEGLEVVSHGCIAQCAPSLLTVLYRLLMRAPGELPEDIICEDVGLRRALSLLVLCTSEAEPSLINDALPGIPRPPLPDLSRLSIGDWLPRAASMALSCSVGRLYAMLSVSNREAGRFCSCRPMGDSRVTPRMLRDKLSAEDCICCCSPPDWLWCRERVWRVAESAPLSLLL